VDVTSPYPIASIDPVEMEDSMNMRIATLAACTLAALAFASAPASAQVSVGGISVDTSGATSGNTSASTGNTGGSTATASTSGGSAFGGSGPTTANITLGTGGTVDGTGTNTANATIGSGTTSGDPSGQVTINGGSSPASNSSSLIATLNGIDENGNPSGSVVINPNGDDGTTVTIGDTGGTGGTGGNPDAIGNLADLSPAALQSALNGLSDGDVAKLKKNCALVLSSPGSFDADTVAVCNVLASL
jgi:hypothetical protein